MPSLWLEFLPAIGTRKTFDHRCWLVLRFEIRSKRGFFAASVWPTSESQLRQKVIKRLTDDKKEFGFRLLLKTITEKWTQLGREPIGEWAEEDGPDEDTVLEAVRKKLDELATRLSGIPDALQPILDG